MTTNVDFEIYNYDFNSSLVNEFKNSHYAKDLWPIVYILSNGTSKEAYVGETTDAYSRMANHLKNDSKNILTAVHLIASDKFNKSATLDIESNLIKYISGDGIYKLINANIGLANHNYYQKKAIYWEIFVSIWNKLRGQGLTKHSLEHISNSDLFKYSPYKTLTAEQRHGLLAILRNLLNDEIETTIIEGGAGTGKTILAVFLFKLMNSDLTDFNFKEFGEDELEFSNLIRVLKIKYPSPKMALVVPMSSFRNTLKKVFKNIKGLNQGMVVGPSDVANGKFDIIMVDESHRLRQRINLGAYFGAFDKSCQKLGLDKYTCSELDWMRIQSSKLILFYDENQSIKPSDTSRIDFEKLKSYEKTGIEHLISQLRVKGGLDYVQYIDDLLRCSINNRAKFDSKEYEFILFDSIEDMVGEIKKRDSERGLSRLIAGYSWPWVSKKNKSSFDIKIESTSLHWNGESDDWINSPNSVNEVGCIHTTQGYDLNYAGIIFGNEISYDPSADEIFVVKENYFDANGKNSITDGKILKSYILNIYRTMMLRGIRGTYVYACNKHLREYLAKYIALFKNPTPQIKLLQSVKVVPFENSIPLFDLRVAAGGFSPSQIVSENVEDFSWIELPAGVRGSKDLFACRVTGESMNRVIPNGSICLFRQYSGGSRNGKIVLVELTDLQDPDSGSRYTVKEYCSIKNVSEDGWQHETIFLKPLSHDSTYLDIELKLDESVPLKVIGVFEKVLDA